MGNTMQRTDSVKLARRVATILNDAASIAHEISRNCSEGAGLAQVGSPDADHEASAQEIRARLTKLLEFVNGGTEFTTWLVNREAQ